MHCYKIKVLKFVVMKEVHFGTEMWMKFVLWFVAAVVAHNVKCLDRVAFFTSSQFFFLVLGEDGSFLQKTDIALIAIWIHLLKFTESTLLLKCGFNISSPSESRKRSLIILVFLLVRILHRPQYKWIYSNNMYQLDS